MTCILRDWMMWCDWVTTFYHVSQEDDSEHDSVETELLWLRLRARARLPNRDKHMILQDAKQTFQFREYDVSTLYGLVYY